MIHLRDYLINEQWQEDFIGDFDTDCTIIQESHYIRPLCLDSIIGTSYNKHIYNIYERLGESIFRKEEFEKHPDVQFILILKNDKTGYSPEAPSARIYFDEKETHCWIENKCKSMNYYCSAVKRTKGKYSIYGELYVQVNPNKPRECSQKILNESGGLVIHLTTNDGLNKILKNGIVPKTPSKDIRPEQIYFLSPTNECIECLEQFCLDLTENRIIKNKERRAPIKIENKKLIKWLNDKKYFDNVHYAVIFNIKNLKKYRKINFYEDTTTPGFPAYWTSEYIPASEIIGWQQIIF